MKRETSFTVSNSKTRLFHLRTARMLNDGVLDRDIYEQLIQFYKDKYNLSHQEYNERAGLV